MRQGGPGPTELHCKVKPLLGELDLLFTVTLALTVDRKWIEGMRRSEILALVTLMLITHLLKAERIKLWRSFQKLRNLATREARKLRYQTAMTRKESAIQASKIAAAKKKQLFSNKADGCCATRRNHRGERVGEASHPGPTRCLSSLGLWSLNIRNWNKHGAALLDEAEAANVHIVCCQETNLYSCDFEVAVAAAHRQGWQLLCTPPVGNRRGGLAVAVREPLAAAQIQKVSNETGQVLRVEIHSSGAPFRDCLTCINFLGVGTLPFPIRLLVLSLHLGFAAGISTAMWNNLTWVSLLELVDIPPLNTPSMLFGLATCFLKLLAVKNLVLAATIV